jgi:hypothetical protein
MGKSAMGLGIIQLERSLSVISSLETRDWTRAKMDRKWRRIGEQNSVYLSVGRKNVPYFPCPSPLFRAINIAVLQVHQYIHLVGTSR